MSSHYFREIPKKLPPGAGTLLQRATGSVINSGGMGISGVFPTLPQVHNLCNILQERDLQRFDNRGFRSGAAATNGIGLKGLILSGSQTESQVVSGTFEPDGKGAGRLRSPEAGYCARPTDATVTREACRSLQLRGGESIVSIAKPSGDRGGIRIESRDDIESINDGSVDDYIDATPFVDLTPIDPRERIRFETPGGPLSMRIVDLLTPIGLGQRGLIVAPPRTGKTILLQQMAAGIAANHPDVYMIILLIDERPEEVTEMRRSVHGEVIASSNDRDLTSHIRISRLIIEKAKRMVECGRDVLVLLDSLTRMGRAFNAAIRGGGRIMSGGLDIKALIEPKSIFGAARNIENGGSLTIIASCLIETGSRMDDVIFNEFKGTGNMEIILSNELANRRLWPAIDLPQSGTRKEELLLDKNELAFSHSIRRTVLTAPPVRAMEALLAEMGKHSDNASMLANLAARSVG